MNASLIRQTLQEYDVKPSLSRIKIYDYLYNNRIHPSAEMIYKALVDELITLSKTTVYNTMHLFADKGIVRTIGFPNEETRFDINVTPHYHFKCRNCGNVYDIPYSKVDIESSVRDGFDIETVEVHMIGRCPKCS